MFDIWTKPVGDDPLRRLVVPDNIDEIAQRAREESRVILEKRLRQFRVRITQKILNQPIW